MEVLDLNFDGDTDFGLFAGRCNNMIPYYYWTWDREAGQYQFACILQGAEAHPESGETTAEYKSGSAGSQWVTEYYWPDGNGSPIPAIWTLSGRAHGKSGSPGREISSAPGPPSGALRQTWSWPAGRSRSMRAMGMAPSPILPSFGSSGTASPSWWSERSISHESQS